MIHFRHGHSIPLFSYGSIAFKFASVAPMAGILPTYLFRNRDSKTNIKRPKFVSGNLGSSRVRKAIRHTDVDRAVGTPHLHASFLNIEVLNEITDLMDACTLVIWHLRRLLRLTRLRITYLMRLT